VPASKYGLIGTELHFSIGSDRLPPPLIDWFALVQTALQYLPGGFLIYLLETHHE
jgi:hypothetical protein